MRPDAVTPEMAAKVLYRDKQTILKWLEETKLQGQIWFLRAVCIAPMLDPLEWGACSGRTTLDHVKDQPMMGKRAQSDEAHLVSLCAYHHLESGWATSHRPILRAYLRGFGGSYYHAGEDVPG